MSSFPKTYGISTLDLGAPPEATRPVERIRPTTSTRSSLGGYDEAIDRIFKEERVSPELGRALIKQESTGNPNAVSSKGARGLGQLMPGTFKEVYPEGDINNPEHNIRASARYLRKLYDADRSQPLENVLAGYNAGPGAVRQYGGIPPYKETQNYVERIGSNLQSQSQPSLSSDTGIATSTITPTPAPVSVQPRAGNFSAPQPYKPAKAALQQLARTFEERKAEKNVAGMEAIGKTLAESGEYEYGGEGETQYVKPKAGYSTTTIQGANQWLALENIKRTAGEAGLPQAQLLARELAKKGYKVEPGTGGWPAVTPPAGLELPPDLESQIYGTIGQNKTEARQRAKKEITKAALGRFTPVYEAAADVVSPVASSVAKLASVPYRAVPGETGKGLAEEAAKKRAELEEYLTQEGAPPGFRKGLAQGAGRIAEFELLGGGLPGIAALETAERVGEGKNLLRAAAEGGATAAGFGIASKIGSFLAKNANTATGQWLSQVLGNMSGPEIGHFLQTGQLPTGETLPQDLAFAIGFGTKGYLAGRRPAPERIQPSDKVNLLGRSTYSRPSRAEAGLEKPTLALPPAPGDLTGRPAEPVVRPETQQGRVFEGYAGRGAIPGQVGPFVAGEAGPAAQVPTRGARGPVEATTAAAMTEPAYIKRAAEPQYGEAPPIPETAETLTAQIRAMQEGRKPAVLLTPGSPPVEVPPGFRTLSTSVGRVIYDPRVIDARTVTAKVQDGTFGELLGYVAPKPAPGEPAVVVSATDARGSEVRSALVPPEAAEQQAQVLQTENPEARVEIKPESAAQEILQQRLEGNRDVQGLQGDPRQIETEGQVRPGVEADSSRNVQQESAQGSAASDAVLRPEGIEQGEVAGGPAYRLPGESIESYYQREMAATAPERRVPFEKFKAAYDESVSQGEGPEPGEAVPMRPEIAAQMGKGKPPQLQAEELREMGVPALDMSKMIQPAVALAKAADSQAKEISPAEPNKKWYHFSFSEQPFDTFESGKRGAIYFAESPEQAKRGASAGYRERLPEMYQESGAGPSYKELENGHTITIQPGESLKIYQEAAPDRLTESEYDAEIDRLNSLRHEKPEVLKEAKKLLGAVLYGRAATTTDSGIVYREKLPNIGDKRMENPNVQEALRLLGFDAAYVGDEAGRSLAVINPEKIEISGRQHHSQRQPRAEDGTFVEGKPSPDYTRRNPRIHENTEILTAVKELGGINLKGSPGEMRMIRESAKERPGLINNEGYGADEMARLLEGHGFGPFRESGTDNLAPSVLDVLDTAARGKKIYNKEHDWEDDILAEITAHDQEYAGQPEAKKTQQDLFDAYKNNETLRAAYDKLLSGNPSKEDYAQFRQEAEYNAGFSRELADNAIQAADQIRGLQESASGIADREAAAPAEPQKPNAVEPREVIPEARTESAEAKEPIKPGAKQLTTDEVDRVKAKFTDLEKQAAQSGRKLEVLADDYLRQGDLFKGEHELNPQQQELLRSMTEKGTEGKLIQQLFRSPDPDAGIPAFFAAKEVREAVGLDPLKTQDERYKAMKEVKSALAKALGVSRSSKITSEQLRQWVKEQGFSADTVEAFEAANKRRIAVQRNLELGGKETDPPKIQDYRRDISEGPKSTMFADPIRAYKSTLVLGYDLYQAGKSVAQWSREMVSRLGAQVRPLLSRAWDEIKRLHEDERGFVRFSAEQQAPEQGPVGKRIRPEQTGKSAAQGQLFETGKPEEPVLKPEAPSDTRRPHDQGWLSDAIKDAAKKPQSKWQVVSAVRKAGLLSSFKTHARNVTGNAAFQLFDEVSRAPAVVADFAASAVTGQRSITGPSPVAMLDSVIYGLKQGGKEAAEIMKHGATAEQRAKQQLPEELDSGSKIVDTAVNTVFRLMGAEDRLFFNGAQRRNLLDRAKVQAVNESRQGKIEKGAVKTRTREIAAKPSQEMQASADHDALVATFNNSNTLSMVISKARSKFPPAANFAIDLVMPFDRTPTNIMTRIVEASPLGFAKNARQAAKALINKGMTVEEQRQFSQTFGRATTGTALMTLGWILAGKGLMTGFYNEDESARKENRDKKEAGIQPEAIKIGNQWFSIAGISPIAQLLATGATLRERGSEGIPSVIGETLGSAPVAETSKRLTKALSSEAKLENFAGGLAGSFIPSGVADVATATDPKARKAFGFQESIQKRVPGWRNKLEEDVNVEQRRSWAVDPFHTTTAKGLSPQAAARAKRKQIVEAQVEKLHQNESFKRMSKDRQREYEKKFRARIGQ